MALKSDGSIVAWGNNKHGETIVPYGNNFIDTTAGTYFGIALQARISFENLLIQDVDNFTINDTYLWNLVHVTGDVTINSNMDWLVSKG